ncbi:hypothetical protein NKJ93_04825 [Mesorhizobium sp. M0028]|uniref:hypothetical protein n=1 Tax=Mesorhizobium sp. M0028 TaxID=2956849 RepID=UPI003335DE89
MFSKQSIVLLGKFNPAIFSPFWVRANGILEIDDCADPSVNVIHEDVCDFTISEVQFTIERNRAKLSSAVHTIADLVGITNHLFGKVLPHTPLNAAGLNLETHEDLGSFKNRNRLGRLLAPTGPWGWWADDFENDDPKKNGGLVNLAVRKPLSTDPISFMEFTVQPSRIQEIAQTHVLFAANNHIEFGKNDEQKAVGSNLAILEHLNETHSGFVSEFEAIVSHLKGLVDAN